MPELRITDLPTGPDGRLLYARAALDSFRQAVPAAPDLVGRAHLLIAQLEQLSTR